MVSSSLSEAYSGGKRPCTSCRKSKVRCDRGSPCGRCRRLGLDCTEQVRTKRGQGKSAKKAMQAMEAAAAAASGRLGYSSTPTGRAREYYTIGRSESLSSMHDYHTAGSSSSYSPASSCGRLDSGSLMMTGDSMAMHKSLLPHGMGRAGMALEEACAPSPLQALVDSLLKLNAQAQVDRTKALAVLRAWGLSCLKHNMTGMGMQLGRMATALGLADWRSVATLPPATTSGAPQQPQAGEAPQVASASEPSGGAGPEAMAVGGGDVKQERESGVHVDSFVKELFSGVSAALVLVSVDGEHRFLANQLFAADFSSAEECEAMVGREREHLGAIDVLGRAINSADKADFFDAVGSALFTSPDACSDMSHIAKVDTRHGESYVALARLRFVVRDGSTCPSPSGSSYSAAVLSLQRLPPSPYLYPFGGHYHGGMSSPLPAASEDEDDDDFSTTEGDDDPHHCSMLRHDHDGSGPHHGDGQLLPLYRGSSSPAILMGSSVPGMGQPGRRDAVPAEVGGGGFPSTWLMDGVDQEDLWGGPVSGSIKRDLDEHDEFNAAGGVDDQRNQHHHHQPQMQDAPDMLNFLDNLF